MTRIKKIGIILTLAAIGQTYTLYSMHSSDINIPKYREFIEKNFEVVEWPITSGESLTKIANYALQDSIEDKYEYIDAVKELNGMENSYLVAGNTIKVLLPKEY